jgi:outer membrane autotransporter protein
MKRNLCTLVIFALIALFSATSVSAAETFDESVVNAKANAANPIGLAPTGWVASDADMFKVGVSGSDAAVNYGLKYYNNQLIVRTASTERAYNGYYSPNVPTTAGSNYSIYGNKNVLSAWVTMGKGMTGFIDGQGLTAGTAVKGLERGLGMSDGGTHDAIFEMAVTVSDTVNPYLLRPTRNPNPTTYSTNFLDHGTNAVNIPADAAAAGIGTGAAADAVYANYKAAYTAWMTSNYPWTQLGYTYYWGQAANKPAKLSDVQGMSEFILLGNTGNSDGSLTPSGTSESGKVVVVGIYATQSYLYTKNNGTILTDAAGAQYGNGFASFNVTGPCNTLWAGAAFQVGTNLNAASPNTITVGAGGSVSGGQGILVGSQNYTVTNAGLITANANTKKFNLAGSENIALLFKGDTHATPYVGAVKNILINSGTITAPAGNGTAVAVWAGNTDITNTGTITGTGTGYAIKTASGNDTVKIDSISGSVSGRIDLGTGIDVLAVRTGGTITGAITTGDRATVTVDGGTLNMTGGVISANGITGGNNADTITLSGGTINGDIRTGAGNDKLTVSGGEITGKVDLGTGTDIFSVTNTDSNAKLNFTLNKDTPNAAQILVKDVGAGTVGIANNTTLAVTVAGTKNVQNNDRFLIVDTDALTVTPANLTIQNDPSLPMITFSATKDGNKLYLLASRNNSYYGQNTGNTSLGAALDSLANSATGDFANVLGDLDSSGSSGNARKLEPTVNGGTVQASHGTIGQFTNTVISRIDQVWSGSVAGTGPTGISTGDEPAKWGVWSQAFGAYLNQGARGSSSGYSANIWGGSLGFDRLLFDHFMFGLSGGYARNYIRTNDANTRTDADSYQGSLYASLARDAYYIDGVLSYAYNRYDASRHIAFGTTDRVAKSNYGGQQYSGYLEGGYTLKNRGLNITPLVSLQYMRLHLNDYSESGADSLNLAVDAQTYNTLQSGLGAKLAYPILYKDSQIIPEVHVKWLYDFTGDQQQATSTFTGSGASFSTKGFDPPKSSYNAGAKITLMTKFDLALSLNYDFEMKEDFHSHAGYVNVRYTF